MMGGAPITITAPGKLMLAGEYAVLEGAPALVCAVSVRARATWQAHDAATMRHEVAQTSAICNAAGYASHEGNSALSVHVETPGFGRENAKFGLGSSGAAAAVCAAAYVVERYGEEAAEARRDEIFELARSGHRAVAPLGSGTDVAASVYGGYLRVTRVGASLDIAQVHPGAKAFISVVWTGTSARTSDFVSAVAAFATRDPHAYHAIVREQLCAASQAFIAAFLSGNLTELVQATREHARVEAILGAHAGIAIVDANALKIGSIAESCDGASKPSGAGGGDISLGIFSSDSAQKRFENACAREGFELLSLSLGEQGVRVEPPNISS